MNSKELKSILLSLTRTMRMMQDCGKVSFRRFEPVPSALSLGDDSASTVARYRKLREHISPRSKDKRRP